MTKTTHITDVSQRVADGLSKRLSFEAMIFAYWASFWIANGLDKFLNRTVLLTDVVGNPLLTWFGKDRSEQFGLYFERLSLDPAMIDPLLAGLGVIELAVGLVALAAMFLGRSAGAVGQLVLKLTLAVFIAFCVGDVVIGDRAELLEHSTYIAVIIASYVVISLRGRGDVAVSAADQSDDHAAMGFPALHIR
ncbi:MAG: hypothetical protein AAFX39_02335 [Pseudomonadota bacterium]